MAKVLFSNNAVTSLASYISSTSTTMTLVTGTGALFPEIKKGSGDYFYVTVLDTSGSFEIVKVTARTADICTIVRAQDNTKALNFPQGSTVEQRVTAASLNDIVNTLIDNIRAIPSSIYPVGSIYMSLNSADPATLFGGSWDKLEDGRVLIGANSTYAAGTVGGSFTHTLTTSELPAHTHSGSADVAGAHTHNRGTMEITGSFVSSDHGELYSSGAYAGQAKGAFTSTLTNVNNVRDDGLHGGNCVRHSFVASNGWSGETSSSGNHTHELSVDKTGENKAHSIMQPYLAVHMWKRVA